MHLLLVAMHLLLVAFSLPVFSLESAFHPHAKYDDLFSAKRSAPRASVDTKCLRVAQGLVASHQHH